MPAALRNPHGAEAGAAFRRLREGAQWTQADVERETKRLFGAENGVRIAQLSRIEKGDYDRVSLDDAVRLGRLYGLSPNQVAEMYGLYTETETNEVPKEVRDLLTILGSLPFDLQQQALSWVRYAMLIARGEAAERELEEQKQRGTKHAIEQQSQEEIRAKYGIDEQQPAPRRSRITSSRGRS